MLSDCSAGRLLRLPWTARRSSQSVLKGINPEYSLEGLMLTLKLQYCGHLIQRTDSLEKTLILGKIGSKRRTGQCRMKWLDSITNSVQFSRSVVSDSATPWTAALQPSLPIITPMSIESMDAVQPSHPLSSPSPPTLNLSQHQGLFKWVSSLHQMAKIWEFQLQHQSFQWTPNDLL